MPYSLPLLSLPAYYMLAVYPHGHAVWVGSGGSASKWDNRNPKSSTLQASLKSKLSAEDFAKFERCESCHRNAMENMPLYFATVLAGVFAEHTVGASLGTGVFCAAWMLTRFAYTVNYINTGTQEWSQLRSILYFVGTFLCFGMLVRAAGVLGLGI